MAINLVDLGFRKKEICNVCLCGRIAGVGDFDVVTRPLIAGRSPDSRRCNGADDRCAGAGRHSARFCADHDGRWVIQLGTSESEGESAGGGAC